MSARHVIERLQRGERVDGYRESGNSMRPIISHREPVDLAPVVDPAKLRRGDIVLCRVGGSTFPHLIHGTGKGKVLIGNNHGHMNGWTTWDRVYGVVVAISGVYRRNSQHPRPTR